MPEYESEISMDEFSTTARDVVNSMDEYITDIKSNFVKSADELRLGRVKEGLAVFSQVIDALATLVELLEKLAEHELIDTGESYTNSMDSINDFLELIEEAYGKGDLISVADIIEYESEKIDSLYAIKLSEKAK